MNAAPTWLHASDRAMLREDLAPLANGAHRGTVRIASPGVLEYPWGTIRVPREVLAADALHRELAGVPIYIEHPEGRRGDGAIMVDELPMLRVGSILSAGYDDSDGADGALVAQYVIDHPAGLAWLRDARARDRAGVSLAYDFRRSPGSEADGADYVQTARSAPNHLALTTAPRDRTAQVLDSRHTDPPSPQEAAVPTTKPPTATDSIREAMDAYAEARAEAAERSSERDAAIAERDAMRSELDAMRTELDALKAAAEMGEDQADPAEALDSLIERTVQMREIARAHGLADPPARLGALRARLAEHLGADKQTAADSRAAEVWIRAATRVKPATARDSYRGREYATDTADSASALTV